MNVLVRHPSNALSKDLSKEEFRELNNNYFALSTLPYEGNVSIGYLNNCMIVANGIKILERSSGPLAKSLVVRGLGELGMLNKRISVSNSITLFDYRQSVDIAIEHAVKSAKSKGRCDATLCAVFIDLNTHRLFTYVLGDCKCIVIRKGEVVYESPSLLYDFHLPLKISTEKDFDKRKHAHVESFCYESGDLCLLFSDGLSNNIFVDEIIHLCHQYHHKEIAQIANELTKLVQKKTKNQKNDNNQENISKQIPLASSALSECNERMARNPSSIPLHLVKTIQTRYKTQQQEKKSLLNKKILVEKVDFYTIEQLLEFADMNRAKLEDVSLCIALLP